MDADIADGAMGYDCFAVRKGGIRGVTADWKVGTAAERMTMDYAASDHTDAVGLFLCTAGEYGFLFEATEYGPKGRESSPVLYLPAPDRVLSEVTVLTARTTVTLSSAVKAAVNTFNQTHTDVRIELDDSELYEGEEAENRLAQEIVTGTAVPDILIGASDSEYTRQAVRKNLYTDLMPYIRTDGLVNESNLFGAVMRAFDDGQGGLWGLAPNFQLSPTLLSLPELLGSYADRGYWTLTEFLDFAESLPTDTELLHGLKRDSNVLLNAGGYEQFIDRESGTCSFDSPGFIRFLNFVRSLPTEEEYRRTEWGSLSEDELAEMRLKGKIALSLVSPSESGQELITAYGTKDWTMIGLPAAEERAGAGISVRMGQVFVITSSCSRPDAAWEFLRLCFTDESGQGGSPSLRSAFRSLMEEYYPMEFVNFYSLHADTGIGYWQPRDEDRPTTEKDLPYPGIISDYTPTDTAKMETVFDSAGMPLLVTWDTEIRDILFEELSAFRAGLGMAEDCAGKIQSRVSIWLAEHH